MDNPVQKLAAIECPECNHGVAPKGGDEGTTRYYCPSCHGTGRAFWQLWRECGGGRMHEGPWQEVNNEWICQSCQGTGWVLKPEAEWMGILVRIGQEVFQNALAISKLDGWAVKEYYSEWTFGHDTPEDALAQAIIESLAEMACEGCDGLECCRYDCPACKGTGKRAPGH